MTAASIDNSELNLEEGASRFRRLTGFPDWLRLFFGLATPIVGLVFILDLPFYLTKVSLFPQQFLGLLLAFALAYVFLVIPASPRLVTASKVPWYDWLLILVSLLGGFYVAFLYPALLTSLGLVSIKTLLIGGSLILAILEATRRLTGWVMLVIIALFALYARFGYLLPGFLAVKPVSWPRLINQLFLGSEFLFGIALQTAGAVVLAFVLFGQFLFGTGGAGFFLNLAQATMGKFRGGPAKIAIVASALMGTVSGSAVGNVAAIGIITIPLMKRTGYSAHFAGGVEAVSSTGGVIMPPIMGAAAFIMATLLGIPYFEVALVAAVPAILYYMGEFLQVDLRAAREGLKGIPKEDLPSLKRTIVDGWIYVLPIIGLIYFLFFMRLSAELSATYSMFVLLLVATARPSSRRFWLKLGSLLEGATVGILEVLVISASAGLVIGILSYTGLGLSFSQMLTQLSGGSLLLLAVLTAIASTILGMGMPITATYLFLAALTAPAMIEMGVPPILAHLFVLYFGAYSFLTPPVCMAVYASASIAKAPLLKTAWQAMKLAIAGYIVPFIFIYKPAMVFMGSPFDVILALFDSFLAVFCLGVAAEGYFRRELSWVERTLFLITALALFVPGWISRVVGIVMLLLLIFLNYGVKAITKQKTVIDD